MILIRKRFRTSFVQRERCIDVENKMHRRREKPVQWNTGKFRLPNRTHHLWLFRTRVYWRTQRYTVNDNITHMYRNYVAQ